MLKALITFLSLILSASAHAHIMMVSPLSRSTSDNIKFVQPDKNNPDVAPDNPDPCGGLPRGTTNLVLTAGSELNMEWRETINHPGRFYVQFSPAEDKGFWEKSNELIVIEDNQIRGTTTTTVRLPDIECDNCTLRVLQEMDDQPRQFYVHCIDIALKKENPSQPPPNNPQPPPSPSQPEPSPPAPGDNSRQNTPPQTETQAAQDLPEMGGGCGTITTPVPPGPPAATGLLLLILLFLIPPALVLALRRGPLSAQRF